MDGAAIKPGILLGSYPEQQPKRLGPLDRAVLDAARRLIHSPYLDRREAEQFARRVEETGNGLANESLGEVMTRLKVTQSQLTAAANLAAIDTDELVTAFALIRELSRRALGMQHYRNQIMGGWLMLQGKLAEMATGEGKTLTAALPASVAALAGIPVHVLTTSDYLASRDADSLAPLYALLGLKVGVVTADMQDPEERRRAYACDITYTTNKQVGFDYLRDRTAHGSPGRLTRLLSTTLAPHRKPVMRGLSFAIVDEADSVLIDEARTPLVLSRQLPNSPPASLFKNALQLANVLEAPGDYVISNEKIILTDTGKARLEKACSNAGSFWNKRGNREEFVRLALTAVHLFKRDEHYLVADGAIHIIDANTGRRMEGRSWERGLHQLIETREEVEVTPFTEVLGKISYQQLFQRYLHLGAMSGTATEVRAELLATYQLPVVPVPSNKPSLRVNKGGKCYPDHAAKLAAIVTQVSTIHASGQPVLIGTNTLAASEELAALFDAAGLRYWLLNARQDAHEAEIIAQAGQRNSITIATNMAGRGTDIGLGKDVAELGGLHVIVTSHNSACRLDRQLIGRCGRQGDPGSYEYYLSPDDEIVNRNSVLPPRILSNIPYFVGYCIVRILQRATERRQQQLRKSLMDTDRRIAEGLSFSGPG